MPNQQLREFTERLHGVIRDSYDEPSLSRLLLYKLGEQLGHISPTGTAFDTVVFRLVLWADQNGRMLELAHAVAKDKENRQDARILATQMTAALEPSSERFPKATPESGVPEPVITLIRAFERIRQVMPSGDQRTVVMEDIVTQMRALPLTESDLPGRFHLSSSEGERLAAMVALRLRPDAAYLRWLSERILVEYAFCGYQAAVAIREAATILPTDILDDVSDAIRQALDWIASLRIHGQKHGRQRVLDEAVAAVIKRCAGRELQ